MIALRPAESDPDLEAWRRVRLLLLAELDGDLAGSGFADRSDMAGLGSLAPRVLPEARRRGVGAALLATLATHLAARGFSEANALVDDDGSLAFAARFGFREVDRLSNAVYTELAAG